MSQLPADRTVSEIRPACLIETLIGRLRGFKASPSPLFGDFSFEQMLDDLRACQVIKEKDRRQVFHLQAGSGDYFLKCSTLIRPKDRTRHFLLPLRRWAEWHNLHRLRAAGIEAARPLCRGESKSRHPREFFIITEKVAGISLDFKSLAHAGSLGRYLAHLHARGVYHADLHPANILIEPDGRPCVVDAQEVFILHWLPHRLRLRSLGKLFFHFPFELETSGWIAAFLNSYNPPGRRSVTAAELINAAARHRHRYYRSRSRRCCKNSTEFAVVRNGNLRGYRRRDFRWGVCELQQALQEAIPVKVKRVFVFNDVCIKVYRKRVFHRDRCLASWKMSRALEIRDICVPRARAYLQMAGERFFLSDFLAGGVLLNDYLSALPRQRPKRLAIRKLARWLQKIHACHIYQRDFKSSNVLFYNGEYCLVDLDGVKIQRLSDRQKIVNLAQLNASLSNAVSIRDRLRFYYYYAPADRSSRARRRAVYRKIWAITGTRHTAAFNLDMDQLLR